jgi:hypothetical protein
MLPQIAPLSLDRAALSVERYGIQRPGASPVGCNRGLDGATPSRSAGTNSTSA